MKILYFHQHFSTPNGSTGIRSYVMAKALINQNHQVTMVCGSFGQGNTGLTHPFKKGFRRGFVEGIEVIEFEIPYSNSMSFLNRIFVFLNFALKSIRLVFTENYDVVFATSTPLTISIPAIFSKWFRRKPFIFEVRDLWPELPKAMKVINNPIILKLMSYLEWISYHSADRLIGLSPGITKGIQNRGINPDKIASIPNGCDINIFKNCQYKWRPNQVQDTDFLAIYTGTHGMANGLTAVIEVAKVLKARKRNDIKFVLVGDGMQKPQLQAMAKELELDNIIFHNPVNKEKLAGLMSSANLGLQILSNIPAFYYGTSPNKFFDYISAGLPVLNNYPGWLADLILDKQCGFVVSPENTKEFADAIEFAANNSDELQKMGLQSQQLAHEKFNREDLANHFVRWVTEGIRND